MLQSTLESYTVGRFERAGNAAAVELSWPTKEGRRVEWAQALVLRGGRIVHMQDFADPANAFKAIRR